MKVALIDADVLAFQAAVVSEKATDWGDGMWTLHADEGNGEKVFSQSLNNLQEAIEADSVILAFSDKENWRKAVLPTYKSNRAGTRQPLIRAHLVKWASDKYETFTRPTLEGDDVLGILATRESKDELVICSIDKDMKTIPGTFYDFGRKQVLNISEAEADYWHLKQTLMGDTVDGYSGLPGVGPVAADKILEPFRHDSSFDVAGAWQAIVQAFEKKGFGEEYALAQARVARICRAEDYDFKKRQVKLWTPTI